MAIPADERIQIRYTYFRIYAMTARRILHNTGRMKKLFATIGFLAFATIANCNEKVVPASSTSPAARIVYLVRHGHYVSDKTIDEKTGPGISPIGSAQANLVGFFVSTGGYGTAKEELKRLRSMNHLGRLDKKVDELDRRLKAASGEKHTQPDNPLPRGPVAGPRAIQ